MAYILSLNIQANRPLIHFQTRFLKSALKVALVLKKWTSKKSRNSFIIILHFLILKQSGSLTDNYSLSIQRAKSVILVKFNTVLECYENSLNKLQFEDITGQNVLELPIKKESLITVDNETPPIVDLPPIIQPASDPNVVLSQSVESSLDAITKQSCKNYSAYGRLKKACINLHSKYKRVIKRQKLTESIFKKKNQAVKPATENSVSSRKYPR